MCKYHQEIPLKGPLSREKGKRTGWGGMAWVRKDTARYDGTDVKVLQPPISRILTPEMLFRPWLRSCALLLGGCLFPRGAISSACEEQRHRRRDNTVGSHGEGTGQVVFHSLRKHLHVHVSSPPSPWLLIDSWAQRWLPVLEIRFYCRDTLGACQLWHQEKIKAGPGSEERRSH